VEHYALSGHAQDDIQFSGTEREGWRQIASFAVSPMRRCVPDAPVRSLQIHIDDPFVQELAKGAEHDDGVLIRIIIVAL
jgi:hypothetical protein